MLTKINIYMLFKVFNFFILLLLKGEKTRDGSLVHLCHDTEDLKSNLLSYCCKKSITGEIQISALVLICL